MPYGWVAYALQVDQKQSLPVLASEVAWDAVLASAS